MKLDRHINVRIPARVHDAILILARQSGEGFSKAVRAAIEKGLREDGGPVTERMN